MSLQDKEYFKELKRLNQELQQENAVRVHRIKEHKRAQIIESHIATQEKNAQKKHALELYDCYMRRQAVLDHKMKQATFEVLGKLMKADPYKNEQRNYLVNALRMLNQQFGLQMPLTMPTTTKHKDPEDENEQPNTAN